MLRIIWTLAFAISPSYLLITLHAFLRSKVRLFTVDEQLELLSFARYMLCTMIGCVFGTLIAGYRLIGGPIDLEFETRFSLMLTMTHGFCFLLRKQGMKDRITVTELQVYGGAGVICGWLHLYAQDDVWHHLLLCWSYVDWLRCTFMFITFQGHAAPLTLIPWLGELYGVLLILPVLSYVNANGHPEPWIFVYIVAVAGYATPKFRIQDAHVSPFRVPILDASIFTNPIDLNVTETKDEDDDDEDKSSGIEMVSIGDFDASEDDKMDKRQVELDEQDMNSDDEKVYVKLNEPTLSVGNPLVSKREDVPASPRSLTGSLMYNEASELPMDETDSAQDVIDTNKAEDTELDPSEHEAESIKRTTSPPIPIPGQTQTPTTATTTQVSRNSSTGTSKSTKKSKKTKKKGR